MRYVEFGFQLCNVVRMMQPGVLFNESVKVSYSYVRRCWLRGNCSLKPLEVNLVKFKD